MSEITVLVFAESGVWMFSSDTTLYYCTVICRFDPLSVRAGLPGEGRPITTEGLVGGDMWVTYGSPQSASLRRGGRDLFLLGLRYIVISGKIQVVQEHKEIGVS